MTIRIAHLSDIHFGGEMVEAVEAAVAAVAAFNPTLTIVTGDLTLNGLPREFRAAAAWLDRLPIARIVTPGNHDTPYWNLFLRALTPFDRYRRHIGAPDAARFECPGLVAWCLNSARGAQTRLDWSLGAISPRRLRGLDWTARSDDTLRVFACHHPLPYLEGEGVEGGVRNGARAMEDLASAGVDLILSGHVHNPFVLPLAGEPAKGWAIGAGTLSLRQRGTPASFTTIIAEADVIDIAAQGWTGERFETVEAWRVPRPR